MFRQFFTHLGPDVRVKSSGWSKVTPLVEGMIGAWAAIHSSRHTRQEAIGALARDTGSTLALRGRWTTFVDAAIGAGTA
jgi:hypothetical protein